MLAAYNMPLLRGPYPDPQDAETRRINTGIPFTADFHSDALLWGTDLRSDHYGGMVNFPRIWSTRSHLQMFTIVTKVPPTLRYEGNRNDRDKLTLPFILSGRPPSTWVSLQKRALEQCDRLRRYVEKSKRPAILITTRTDLEKFISYPHSDSVPIAGGMLGVEGLHCLEGDLNFLDTLYRHGVRMASPFHLFDNALGGSAHGISGQGLTSFGKKVIRRMNQLGMVIDLAHASEKAVDDILALTVRPVVTSHTGAKGICNNNRNLSDKHLRAIARSGGLIGVGFFEAAVCRPDYDKTAETIRYIVDLTDIDHVCLGSDFDGAVTTPTDVRGLHYLIEALRRKGFDEADIRKIFYENYIRFWKENLEP